MVNSANPPFLMGPQSDLKSCIKVVEHGIAPDLCDLIISEYYSDNCSYASSEVYGETGAKENSSVRNSRYIPISNASVINKNPLIRAEIDKNIFCSINDIVKSYIQQSNLCVSLTQDSGYELIIYSEGSFFNEHTDQLTLSPEAPFDRGSCRQLSVVAQLNDDYSGGVLSFFNDQYLIPKQKGLVVIFPSNFLFPHRVSIVTEGVRFSLVTWLF